jgi:hypothetical protein
MSNFPVAFSLRLYCKSVTISIGLKQIALSMFSMRRKRAGPSAAIFFAMAIVASIWHASGEQGGASAKLIPRSEFVGDDSCRACHARQCETYQRTAHHLTSQLPTAQTIAGKFTPGENVLKTVNPLLTFRMEEKDGSFYQAAETGEPPHVSTRRERIDFVIGSGGKGQTYLSWRGDALYELPVSYWTELGQWVNSPGYLDGVADFDRPIVPRCFECHATYIHPLSLSPNQYRYEKTGYVLGISCERCHGPGRAHVDLFESPPAAVAETKIVNPAKLPRDLALGVCAECHGGLGKSLAPAFSYAPGEPLENFIALGQPAPDENVDVHGNQIALLKRSKCYQSSDSMTCSTCHDEHARERPAASYSEHCLNCHTAENCALFPKLGEKIAADCVDCHMPVQESRLIVSADNGRHVSAHVRNHWIKVYRDNQKIP